MLLSRLSPLTVSTPVLLNVEVTAALAGDARGGEDADGEHGAGEEPAPAARGVVTSCLHRVSFGSSRPVDPPAVVDLSLSLMRTVALETPPTGASIPRRSARGMLAGCRPTCRPVADRRRPSRCWSVTRSLRCCGSCWRTPPRGMARSRSSRGRPGSGSRRCSSARWAWGARAGCRRPPRARARAGASLRMGRRAIAARGVARDGPRRAAGRPGRAGARAVRRRRGRRGRP